MLWLQTIPVASSKEVDFSLLLSTGSGCMPSSPLDLRSSLYWKTVVTVSRGKSSPVYHVGFECLAGSDIPLLLAIHWSPRIICFCFLYKGESGIQWHHASGRGGRTI